MINLLPIQKKAEIRAARTNVLLIRYIVIIVIATTFIIGSLYVTHTVLGLTKASSEQTIASNDLQADVYSSTKAQVDSLSASLGETKTILDQEVRYSKVFVNIAQLMPAGTIFGKLTLDNTSFNGTPTSAKVYAKTSADAVAMKASFENSPLFSSVSFQTIQPTGSTVPDYPVSVDMSFVLNRIVGQ